MRRKTAIMLCLMTLSLASCTHNDGDIGVIFGQWMLDEMYINGDPAPFETTQYNFRFQSNLVVITYNPGLEVSKSYYGTWTSTADTLALNFTYINDLGVIDDYVFDPPRPLGLQARGVSDLGIIRLTGRYMILRYEAPTDTTYIYSLRKLE